MSSSFNAAIPQRTQNLLSTIAEALGVDISLASSASFRATLESVDGQTLNWKCVPLDQGLPARSVQVRPEALDVSGTGGSFDADTESGTATLVASTVDVTVSGGVPVGSLVYATVDSGGGKVKLLSAVRLSSTQIRISSTGSGFGALLDSAGVSAALTAGHNDAVALANAAGDVLAVKETAAGGSAADHFSVVRVNNTTVKVQAHDSAGALVAGNTSTVKVYNFGQAAHETSTVRWIVVRP